MKLRGFLLAGVAALALTAPPSARADMPVIDMSAITRLWSQIQQLNQVIQLSLAQYNQLVATFNSLNNLSGLATAVPQLSLPSIQSPLPPNPTDIQSLLSGLGGRGSLAGLAQQQYQQNLVYAPTGNSWMAQHLTQNAMSIAGAQTVVQQLYQAAAQRIPLMQQLASQLSTASDPKTVLDLQARLGAERAIIESQAVQAQTVTTWFAAQTALQQQQELQKRQQDIDTVLNSDPDW